MEDIFWLRTGASNGWMHGLINELYVSYIVLYAIKKVLIKLRQFGSFKHALPYLLRNIKMHVWTWVFLHEFASHPLTHSFIKKNKKFPREKKKKKKNKGKRLNRPFETAIRSLRAGCTGWLRNEPELCSTELRYPVDFITEDNRRGSRVTVPQSFVRAITATGMLTHGRAC